MTHLTIQQLVAQTDGELTGPSLNLVEKHISECETCWHELERLAEQDALLASVVSIDPGDAFFEDLALGVEAEISGKRKPAPRAAAASPVTRAATPHPEPVVAGPQPGPRAAPEPAAASPPLEIERVPEPAAASPPPEIERAPEPAAASPPPAATRVASSDPPWVAEPPDLIIEPVGGWTPPTPTPDDPFADLVLPPRSTTAPAPPVRAPRPPEPRAARPSPAPGPVPKPAARPAPSAPPNVPPQPTPPREGRRPAPVVPILFGVGTFIAGIAVAVVLTIRLMGIGGIHGSRPERIVPPVTASPGPAPEMAPKIEAPPAVQVEVPPAVIPAPAAEPAAVAAAPTPAPAPVGSRSTPARTRRHAPAAGSTSAPDGALETPSTTVIPVQIIRTETAATARPAAPAPEPAAPAPEAAAPAPQAERGILCGIVRDSDGHPVARAQVMMADVGVVVLTDRAGRFCITAPAGERTLSVVALGFTASRRLVSLGKRTPELSVTLKSAAPFPTPN